jgi:hypothetical protein
MKKYVVVERQSRIGVCLYVSDYTEGLADLAYGSAPYNCTEELNPKVFEKRDEAMKYKTEMQKQSDKDWSENSHIYKPYGDKKCKWKIEEYTGDLLS